MPIILSGHTWERMDDRNVSYEDICFIRRYGYRLYNAGAVFYQLRAKDLPLDLKGNDPRRRLVGSTLVLCAHCRQHVITLYRDEKAFQKDKRKQKFDLHRRAECPCCSRQMIA